MSNADNECLIKFMIWFRLEGVERVCGLIDKSQFKKFETVNFWECSY